MLYTDINATTIENICTPLLHQLIADEFRAGFEDGVTKRCRDEIAKVDSELARKFWSASCAGYIKQGVFTAEFVELMNEAKAEQSKEGRFVMPAWGTRGT